MKQIIIAAFFLFQTTLFAQTSMDYGVYFAVHPTLDSEDSVQYMAFVGLPVDQQYQLSCQSDESSKKIHIVAEDSNGPHECYIGEDSARICNLKHLVPRYVYSIDAIFTSENGSAHCILAINR